MAARRERLSGEADTWRHGGADRHEAGASENRASLKDGGLLENSFRLGRIAGIEIGIHYTWLFIFALVTWSLAQGYFPSAFPGWSQGTYWQVGALSALALFASVLIHELSHSFVAMARGVEVSSIVLFIFGGVSNLKSESEEPKDEFLISIVGPLTSFVLAALFWAAVQWLAPGNSPLGASLGYLVRINVLLGLFNLVPGFPLDGGRVLRSIIWTVSGSMRKATRVATIVGQGFGFLMIFWGVSQIFGGELFNGLWIAFIGWFLNSAAEATGRQQVVQESLRGVPVATLMDREPPMVSPELSMREFVFEQVLRGGERAALVTEDGKLLGIVSISDVKKVPQEEWDVTPVGRIMTTIPLKTVSPETDLNTGLQLLVEGDHNQLPVVQDGRLVGMLSRSDVLRYLQLREELQIKQLPGGIVRSRGQTRQHVGRFAER
jgi:Zn-dependent protease/predicted transcriptional regulator